MSTISGDEPSPGVIRGLRALDALCDMVHARYLARIAREVAAQPQPHPAPGPAGGRAAGATGAREAGESEEKAA